MECVCKLKHVVLNNGTNNIAWMSLLLECDLIFNPVQKSISLVILEIFWKVRSTICRATSILYHKNSHIVFENNNYI